MIVDGLGRRFRNLRVSLTAACNYACTYCVPDGKRLQAATHELSAADMVYAVRLLMDSAESRSCRPSSTSSCRRSWRWGCATFR